MYSLTQILRIFGYLKHSLQSTFHIIQVGYRDQCRRRLVLGKLRQDQKGLSWRVSFSQIYCSALKFKCLSTWQDIRLLVISSSALRKERKGSVSSPCLCHFSGSLTPKSQCPSVVKLTEHIPCFLQNKDFAQNFFTRTFLKNKDQARIIRKPRRLDSYWTGAFFC